MVTLVSGIIQTVTRPLYNWIVSGSIDYICFQKYFLASGVDLLFTLTATSILFFSVVLFDNSFTSEQAGFLITDDNRVISHIREYGDKIIEKSAYRILKNNV